VEIVPFPAFAHGFSVPRTAKRRTNSVFGGGCTSKKKKGFSLFSSFSSSSSSNAGKGDDTIKELNKLDSIVIDPVLVIDPAFWDYCLVPNEQGQMRLKVLSFQEEEDIDASSSSSSSINASDLLVKNGGLKDDVSFYQDTYDLFEEQVFVPVLPPTSDDSCSGLVVRVDTLDLLPESTTQCFSKIIRVQRDDDDGDDANEEPIDTKERAEEKYAAADIEVSSLGELRALTICSYAYLTKRS